MDEAETLSTGTGLQSLSFIHNCPCPETEPAKYTEAKLKERLAYVKEAKTRKVTPRAQLLFNWYEDEAQRAIQLSKKTTPKDESEWLQSCTRVYEFDIYIRTHTEMCTNPTASQLKIQDQIRKLKILEYHCRYGDYLNRELSIFKDNAIKLKTEFHYVFHQYWTDIQKGLLDQLSTLTANPTISAVRVPKALAVKTACLALGVNENKVVWLIQRYAERNELMHRSITANIQKGYYSKLAEDLFGDIKELPRVVPPEYAKDIDHLTNILTELRDTFFEFEEGEEKTPLAWAPSPEFKRVKHSLKEKSDALDAEKELLRKKIAKREYEQRQRESAYMKAILPLKRKSGGDIPDWAKDERNKRIKIFAEVIGLQKEMDKQGPAYDRLVGLRDGKIQEVEESGKK